MIVIAVAAVAVVVVAVCVRDYCCCWNCSSQVIQR